MLPKERDMEKNVHDASEENPQSYGCVAKSKFDIDKFLAEVGEKVRAEMPRILTEALGDVDWAQVEFAESQSSEEVKDVRNNVPSDAQQLSKEETEKAFDTDIRDVEEQYPSEPIEPCPSIDELESMVDTIKNPYATDIELAKAGKQLEPYEVTQFYEALISDEEMERRIKLCMTLAIKAEIEEKNGNISAPNSGKVEKKIIKADSLIVKSKGNLLDIDFQNIDPDNFNPEDFLP